MPRAAVIIPARFASTRLPGKPLITLKNKPIIQHIYEHAEAASSIDTVFVATDDSRIYDAVRGFGGIAIMTASEHASGTDRIAEVAKNIDHDIIINVQGDEPFIRPEMVDDLVELLSDKKTPMGTLARRITDAKDIFDPNVVKVVWDNEGFALYFSRSPIPYHRDIFKTAEYTEQNIHSSTHSSPLRGEGKGLYSVLCASGSKFTLFKHIGVYGYKKDVLLKLASMKQGELEIIERLEQLRALASGIKIKVKETPYDTLGIDTTDDLRKAEEWLNSSL